MPCYLFTYHGYGTWLPDKRRGYVKRGAGILPRDGRMAELYRTNMTQAAVRFEERVQKLAIEELLVACQHQQLRCHFIATDATHVHVLVSWKIDRTWDVVRAKLRESLTRWLNQEIDRQEWFAKSPSRKRVRDRKHFDYLVAVYLPKHAGWKWAEGQGLFL
jgi:hypothetical protein